MNLPADPTGRPGPAEPLVEVGAYTTRSVAELAQATLTAAGIPSVLAGLGDAYPLDFRDAARLMVAGADAEDAAALLSGRGHPNREELR